MGTATAEKKQADLPNMPKVTGAARVALDYIIFKEDLDAKFDGLEKRAEAVKKAMKEEGKTTLVVQSPDSDKKYDFVLKRQEKLSVIRQKEGFKTK